VPRTFLLLGSGEFEAWTHDVESKVLAEATGDGSVLILPTASATEGDAVFDRWAKMGLDHYAEVGVTAEVLPVKVREDALRDGWAARAEQASMIYFSGGKPQHLAKVLRDSPLLVAILRAMDRGRCGRGAAPARWSSAARRTGTAGARTSSDSA
jgi:cyanophycinase-like exopeptidase